jgi:hypothetical protein
VTGGAERRISIRVVYETVAMVAEYDGADFPLFSAFWEVRTRDLSATGMGFESQRRPQSDLLLLMLGNPQASPIFIVARVAHCAVADPADEGRGYIVGCELIKRLSR